MLMRNFPPRFAGASLKPVGADASGMLAGDFPPRFAGASLKQHAVANADRDLRTFPRVSRGPH